MENPKFSGWALVGTPMPPPAVLAAAAGWMLLWLPGGARLGVIPLLLLLGSMFVGYGGGADILALITECQHSNSLSLST